MTDAIIVGENPLVEGLAPFIPISEMPPKLLQEPLGSVNWRSVSPEVREQYLAIHDQHFSPTRLALDIAVRLQGAILGSLAARNPCAPAEQRRINQLSLLERGFAPEALAALANPATAGIVAAQTGLGKTSILKRTLEVIAPDQVMTHPRSEVCGWSKLVQIAYIKLDFPSNGTRGGLVERILAEIDRLVGTDYSTCNRRLRNLDASLVFVMKVLSWHRVGMLVLDEMQRENFDSCPWHNEFVLFILCLLNLGIPVVLCGQPGAFVGVTQEHQTLRRFSSIGNFTLRRALSDSDAWWVKDLAPGVMRFNLCEQIEHPEEIVAMSRHLAAGVPGFFVLLWIEAQRLALRRQGTTAKLTPDDLAKATSVEAILELMHVAKTIEPDDAPSLCDEENTAGAEDSQEQVNSGKACRSTGKTGSMVAKTVRKARQAERRKQREADRNEARIKELSMALPPDDVRLANQALELLAGLDQYQTEMLQRQDVRPVTDAAVNADDGVIRE